MSPAGNEGVGTAVLSARRAYLAHRASPAAERIAWLQAAAAEIERAAERIIESAVRVIGKPRRAARFEAQRSAQFVRACAAHLTSFGGETIPLDVSKAGANLFGFAQRVPYGVIGAVTPFNAPSNLLLQKVAPALATGNAVVVKPAPEGTEIAFVLAECFSRAGLPPGLFNVVAGGAEEAQALAAHPEVAYVTITGGTAAGRALAAAAGAKPFVAELGGNAANIVCADANLADAAKRIAISAFEASGQQCISAQRVVVEERVLDRFLALFVECTGNLSVGDPSLEATDVGPVVNVRAAQRIMDVVDEATRAGAKAILAPQREGCVIRPTIIQSSDANLRLVKDEIFGPVVVVIPAKDVTDAIRIANSSAYGLQASCFTGSLETAFRMSRELEVGSVWVNEGSRFRLDNYPFGGMGASGYGREGVRFAMEAFTQWKFTGLRFPGPE
ncbi:MAG: aldehyde dehydrogenase family protein [Burkholderiales bacterium]|nr:aldehyde dehydrogenase family protein [Burkholderiales bacterium]